MKNRKCDKNCNAISNTRILFGMITAVILLALFAVQAEALTYTVNPVKDSYVSSAMPNTNYGTQTQLKVRSNLLYPRRALLQFADMPTVPPQYQINSATLRIYVESAPWGARTYNAERITSDWSETLVNWKNQPPTAGVSASSLVTPGWVEFDVTDDVKGFYSGAYTNKGWTIKDSTESGVLAIFTQEATISSRESSDPLLRPQLTINYCVDFDGDGYFAEEAGCQAPFDCNDHDAAIYPNAPENCNNVDDNCDGTIDEGIVEMQNCGTDVGACEYGHKEKTCTAGVWSSWSECTGGIIPTPEICDNLDNDCDGTTDEELAESYYTGPEGTQGVGICKAGTHACLDGNWSVIIIPQILPTAEICNNIDDNCDGTIDNGLIDNGLVQSCYEGPAGTEGVGICKAGTRTCSEGAWGECEGQMLPKQEICENGIDENCNGRDEPCFDATCIATNIPDTVANGSKFNASVTMRNDGEDAWTQFYAYKLGSQTPQDNTLWGKSRVEIASGVTVAQGQEYTFNFELTAPSNPGTYPCDWKMLQEYVRWFGETCHKNINVAYNCVDNDQDGYNATSPSCPGGNDCDDSNALINPGMKEDCLTPYDDNCNGNLNDRNALNCINYYYDADNDTFGNATSRCYCKPTGKYIALTDGDCNDNNAAINPGMTEICYNGIDDNCDGLYDAENAIGCFNFSKDVDADTYGANDFKCYCYAHNPYNASINGDCNDTNAAVNPAATESCNGIDDNCDGTIDEEGAIGSTRYFYDNDQDNYGKATDSKLLCSPIGKYTTTDNTDCNDENAAIYPGAAEKCNEIDDDCDLEVDEGCPLRDAECAGMSVPNGMLNSGTSSVSVTMKNKGKANWTYAANFRLGSVGDDATWGITRADIAADATVYTGSNYTFAFDITAPGATGSKTFEWKMLKEGVEWFGQSCKKNISIVDMPDVNYSVSPAIPDGNDSWYKTKPKITLSVNSSYNPTAKAYYNWNHGTELMLSPGAEITAPEGTNTLYFYGKDSYGNIGPVYSLVFKVDSQSPRISAVQPTGGTTIGNSMPHIGAYYNEYGSSGIDKVNSFLEIDDENVNGVSFSTYFMDYYPPPPSPLSDGLHNLTLGVADKAGNMAIKKWSFTVDTTGPTITIFNPVNSGDYTTTTLLLNITTGEQVASIEKSLNNGRYSQLCRYCSSYVGSMGFARGMNVLKIRATDMVGNANESIIAFTITTP